MIRIITIDREYGSGAAGIAKLLAERLGWQLWDEALTTEIARYLQCEAEDVAEREERADSPYYRLFKSFMLGSYEGSLNAPRLKAVDADRIYTASQHVVTAAARSGKSVMVGRGSAYFLRGRPDVLHIFIYAPFDAKVVRLMASGESQWEATHLVETIDRDRAAYIKQYFDVEWPARHFFDLMINSELGEETVVRTIIHTADLLDRQPA